MARPTNTKQVTHPKTVLIIVEGKKTETSYFERLKHALKLQDRVDVRFSGYTDPENIVAVAADELRAKKSLAVPNYTHRWAVFDTEGASHPRAKQLGPAATLALTRGVDLAVSRPSFEVWYLLHVNPTPPALNHGDDAVKHLKVVFPDYSKGDAACAEWSLDKLGKALKHAGKQESQVTIPAHTGTGVHRLVQALLAEATLSDAEKQALGL